MSSLNDERGWIVEVQWDPFRCRAVGKDRDVQEVANRFQAAAAPGPCAFF